MARQTYVGFGFGAIQGGLFLYEAFRTGRFGRLVVAEVMQDVVDAVRGGGGGYRVNIATRQGIESHEVRGVEIFNPRVAKDRDALIDAVADAAEIGTALPSVAFYGSGAEGDVTHILAAGLGRNETARHPARSIIYTAENNNHAAEVLEQALMGVAGAAMAHDRFQCLNTVIGKMSGIVTDKAQIREQRLATVVDGGDRAFLVEEFSRILISQIRWPRFERGISVFEEKADLLPFEEAKLYGHNATHALLGYLLWRRGGGYMADARRHERLIRLAREAFLLESGRALCRKHAGVDPLFTEQGYADYVDDLLERMLNPHLRDTVERVTRDPRRKLGWDDRLVGTMRMAMQQDITPRRYALGAAAALRMLGAADPAAGRKLLDEIWGQMREREVADRVASLIGEAMAELDDIASA